MAYVYPQVDAHDALQPKEAPQHHKTLGLGAAESNWWETLVSTSSCVSTGSDKMSSAPVAAKAPGTNPAASSLHSVASSSHSVGPRLTLLGAICASPAAHVGHVVIGLPPGLGVSGREQSFELGSDGLKAERASVSRQLLVSMLDKLALHAGMQAASIDAKLRVVLAEQGGAGLQPRSRAMGWVGHG